MNFNVCLNSFCRKLSECIFTSENERDENKMRASGGDYQMKIASTESELLCWKQEIDNIKSNVNAVFDWGED